MRKECYLFINLLIAAISIGAAPQIQPPVTASPEASYESGRLIVKFKEGVITEAVTATSNGAAVSTVKMPTSFDSVNKKYGFKSIRRLRQENDPSKNVGLQRTLNKRKGRISSNSTFLRNVYIVDIDPNTDILKATEEYKRDPNVEYVQPDYKLKVNWTPNDPLFVTNRLYELNKIRMPAAWDISKGSGIVIAVVDTGVDINHSDISANIWINPNEIAGNGVDDDGDGLIDDVKGWNLSGNNNNVIDVNGHGSHVAGIIAAVGNNNLGIIGVAPNARIMPVKAFGDDGIGYSSRSAQAIIYAIEHGADVVNNSWYCQGGCSSNPVVEQAVKEAVQAGVVVVFCAGNESRDVREYSPQNMSEVITVAAGFTSNDGRGTPVGSGYSNIGSKVAVVAPGNIIWSLQAGTDSYVEKSGTSMAAPHISGLSALILAIHPNFTPEDVKYAIEDSADVTPMLSGMSGRWVNAEKAVKTNKVLKAEISSPAGGDLVDITAANIPIIGTASGDNFWMYDVSYSSMDTTTWTKLITGYMPVIKGVLAHWDVTKLPAGVYKLQLIARGNDGTVLEQLSYVSIPLKGSKKIAQVAGIPLLAVDQDYVAWWKSGYIYIYNVLTNVQTTLPFFIPSIEGFGLTQGKVIFKATGGQTGIYNIDQGTVNYLSLNAILKSVKDGKILYDSAVYDLQLAQLTNFQVLPNVRGLFEDSVYYLDSTYVGGFLTRLYSLNLKTNIKSLLFDNGILEQVSVLNGTGVFHIAPWGNINMIDLNTLVLTPIGIGTVRFLQITLDKVIWIDSLEGVNVVGSNVEIPPIVDMLNVRDRLVNTNTRSPFSATRVSGIVSSDKYLVWADGNGIFVYGLVKPDTIPPSGSATVVFNKIVSGIGLFYDLNLSATDSGSGMGTGAQVAIQFIFNDGKAPSAWMPQAYALKVQVLVTDGTASHIGVKFMDAAGNWSSPIIIPIPDKLSPTISNGSPSGVLAYNTLQVSMTVTTNENATCKYDTRSGIDYVAMTGTFTTTGGISHSQAVVTSRGRSYKYNVKCRDAALNVNTTDYQINFGITGIILDQSAWNSPYAVGATLPIKWSSVGVNNVSIKLINYKGTTVVRTIATVPASSGLYNWVISGIDFNYDNIYTIMISDAANANIKSTKSTKVEFTSLVTVN